MEFLDLIQSRQSIRVFQPQPIPTEKVQFILEAIQLAPSAGNLQAFRIFAITDENRQRALVSAAMDQTFIATAPLVLVFCADTAQNAARYGKRGTSLYAVQDATIACTYAMLAVADQGLATVWVGAFDETAVSQVLDLPDHLRPVAMLPIGFAGEAPPRRSRRPLGDLIHVIGA